MKAKREPLKIGLIEGTRWEVLEERKRGSDYCRCRCSCGTERDVSEHDLRSGKSISCGCRNSERLSARNYRHGMRKWSEWNVWNQMKQRCSNIKRADYADYGGRGISVCSRWAESFADFIADMGRRPGKDYSLERKKVNGNYEPDNCIWMLKALQFSNTRRTRLLTANNKTQTMQQWAKETGLQCPTILARLRLGWSEQKTLTTPARKHSWKESGFAGNLKKERKCRVEMIRRCDDPNSQSYGGKGVQVCKRWRESFDAFLEDVGPAPSAKHSIDRKDNEGHYSCGQCEECKSLKRPRNAFWETRVKQGRNRSSNHLVTHQGETLCLSEWAERTGIKASVLRQRLSRHKWSIERALTEGATPAKATPLTSHHPDETADGAAESVLP